MAGTSFGLQVCLLDGATPTSSRRVSFGATREIVLRGFDPAGERQYQLPGHKVFVLVGRALGELELGILFLDTLVLDLEVNKAFALYRNVLRRPKPEALEVRMEFMDPEKTEASVEVPRG